MLSRPLSCVDWKEWPLLLLSGNPVQGSNLARVFNSLLVELCLQLGELQIAFSSNILQLSLSLSFFLKFCYIQIPRAWILPCWQATCFLYALFLFKSAHFFVCLFFTWMCLRWASWNTPISNTSASLILNRSVNSKNKKDGNPLLPSATKRSVTESWSDAMA